MYEIDEQQIRQWWSLFVGDNNLVEIRLLGKTTYSGYFKSVDVMIEKLRPLLNNPNPYDGNLQAYYTLNKIDDALYSREQRDKFVKSAKNATADGQVTRRTKVMIDLDPNRVAGVSSSDAELEKAHLKAVDIYRYLIAQGFKEPIITLSGSGYHLYVLCDMPADDEHTELVKRFLQSISKMFSDEHIECDEKVYNLARVDKVVGTWAKKGSDSGDRRWRMAKIVKVPQDLSPNDDSLFQKIADLLPKEEPKVLPNQRRGNYGGAPFDLRTWLNQHGIVYKEEKQGSSIRFTLEKCPWIDQHSDHKSWDSALFQDTEGKITFNCQHSHCKGKTWMDFRLFYEPNAYDRPIYVPQPMYQQRQYVPQPKYNIKEELPELGKKWLCMSDIQKIDLSQIECVKTGFVELDRNIVGLNMSEVTLLSGSNSSGKSSWLNTLLLNIIQQGWKCALWSGELRADILKAWVQMVAAGKNNLKPSNYGDGKYYVPNNVAERIDTWLDGKFFLINNEYGNTWQEIFHDMSELLKVGCRIFMLDNLFSMNIDLLEGDKNNKQKELILQIKDFAKKNQAHIILVAHPRKTMSFLRKNDISGSGDLMNAVDNIFICHRVNNDFFRAGAEFFGQGEIQRFQGFGNVIEVAKNRMYGIVDLMVGMQYEIESRRFKNDVNENVQYGWEIEPTQSTMTFDEPPKPPYNADWNYRNDDANNDMPFGAPSDDAAPF